MEYVNIYDQFGIVSQFDDTTTRKPKRVKAKMAVPLILSHSLATHRAYRHGRPRDCVGCIVIQPGWMLRLLDYYPKVL